MVDPKRDKEFVEIIKSVQKIGTKKALDVLKKFQINEIKIDNYSILVNFTINSVIKEWDNKYKKNDFFHQNLRGEIVQARNTIIVVANKLTFLSPKQLYDYISIPADGVRTIRRTLCEFRELDINNKYDKIIIDRTEKVLLEVASVIKLKTKK